MVRWSVIVGVLYFGSSAATSWGAIVGQHSVALDFLSTNSTANSLPRFGFHENITDNWSTSDSLGVIKAPHVRLAVFVGVQEVDKERTT